MMSDMKKAIQLWRYGEQYQTYMVMGLSWFVFGVFAMAVTVGSSGVIPALFFLMMTPMYMLQCFASLEAAGMVASSTKRKFLFITAQDILMQAGMAVVFLAALLILTIKGIFVPDAQELAGGTFFCVGLFAALVQVYMPLVNKKFISGGIVLAVLYVCFCGVGDVVLRSWKPSYGVGLLLGIVFCILGGAVGHFIRVCLYKKVISRYSLGMETRKYM